MNKATALRIKELRSRKGFSQEKLADETGLNIRTIQRIENGETEPHGHSVKKIAQVLDIAPEELIDWEIDEDNSFLKALNISAIAFLFFPIMGIILPYILWRSKKNRVKGLNQVAREVVNFQITWNLIYFLGLFGIIVTLFLAPQIEWLFIISTILFHICMCAINLFYILLNTILIHKEKKLRYKPKISFLKA
tara:strand:+ start:4819 stop:5397 length:579 start_codon:yes stop_codon:yes gene_type:complete